MNTEDDRTIAPEIGGVVSVGEITRGGDDFFSERFHDIFLIDVLEFLYEAELKSV